MKTCERCGKEYRFGGIAENRGKHLCRDCTSHCSVCNKSLPRSNCFGETASITGAFLGPIAGSLRDSRRPTIGSGMCNECFYKEQEKISQSPSIKATMTSELQTFCRYCGTKNETDAVFCKSCGKKVA